MISTDNGRSIGRMVVRGDQASEVIQKRSQMNLSEFGSGFFKRYNTATLQQLLCKELSNEIDLKLMDTLKRCIPTMTIAEEWRRVFDGRFYLLRTTDGGLPDDVEDDIEDFMRYVPVGSGSFPVIHGVNSALEQMSTSADCFGISFAETWIENSDVERLIVADTMTIRVKKNRYGLFNQDRERSRRRGTTIVDKGDSIGNVEWEQKVRGKTETLVPSEDLCALSFSNACVGGHPEPLFWNTEFIANLIARMMASVRNAWIRGGDPSKLYAVEYAEEDYHSLLEALNGGDIDPNVANLQAAIFALLGDRFSARIGDAVVGIRGGSIKEIDFGAVSDSLLEWMKDHHSVFASQLINKAKVPSVLASFLDQPSAGIGSDRFRIETEIALEAADMRNERRSVPARRWIDRYLTVTGREQYIGQYTLRVKRPNVSDPKVAADVKEIMAKAHEKNIQNAIRLYPDVPEPGETIQSTDSRKKNRQEMEDYLEDCGVYDKGQQEKDY